MLNPNRVNRIVDNLFHVEGGLKYTNRATDAGGPTKGGVTLRTLRAIRKNPNLTEKDVQNLTAAEIKTILRDEFVLKWGFEKLVSEDIAEFMIDWAVNSGPDDPARAAQELCTSLGIKTTVDGRWGPNSLKNTNLLISQVGPAGVLHQLIDKRIRFYATLCVRRPTDLANLIGWLDHRCFAFRPARNVAT
jgi:lysozyme family protein